jgi:hypothetical protein
MNAPYRDSGAPPPRFFRLANEFTYIRIDEVFSVEERNAAGPWRRS